MYTITLTTDYARETWAARTLGEMLRESYSVARAVDAVNGGWASLNVKGADAVVIINVTNEVDGLLAALRNTPVARASQQAASARLRAAVAAAAATEGCTAVTL